MPEKSSHLVFQKYGDAFISINNVEYVLEDFLYVKGRLNQVHEELRDKLLKNATLERKYNLAKNLIADQKIKKDIEVIIGKRQRLAHHLLVPHADKKGEMTGEWSFISGEDVEKLDENFFDETIKLANNIVDKLLESYAHENI